MKAEYKEFNISSNQLLINKNVSFKSLTEISNSASSSSLNGGSSNNKNGNSGSNNKVENKKNYILTTVSGNQMCCDCGASSPTWVSINIGALLCIECSGKHRGL